ncbi:hypothetical protein [Nocardioides nitrophenolicus]|uniref:hypothetical protein n=1 Tax=Nocardioides nitrophenolicus TaxID=60489 RepID=UPI0019588F5C|nr:hypothetical protein [Nocardioides nitrophenolicus]MBM7516723.1 hypothetical protein [Nocardioides nitrophenolicus]
MQSTPTPHKHRASEPVPPGERPATTRAHRGSRTTDLPIAAALGLILLLVAAWLTVR